MNKNTCCLVISLAFVVAGVFLLWNGRDAATAWSAIAFFGACSLVAGWELFRARQLSVRNTESANDWDRRKTLIVKNNITQYAVFAVGSGGFAAAGMVMIATENRPWIGWLTLGFLGPGALLFIWQIVDRRARLVIDSDGVLDRMLGVGKIAWADVEWAYIESIHGHDFICLILKDPSIYLNKLTSWRRKMVNANRVLGFTDLSLNLSGLKLNSEEVLRLVLWHVLEQKNESQEFSKNACAFCADPVEACLDDLGVEGPRNCFLLRCPACGKYWGGYAFAPHYRWSLSPEEAARVFPGAIRRE